MSGGADSVALLYWLYKRAEKEGFSLCAVHCQHGIRGEDSLKDMRFVQNLCKKLSVPLFVFEEDCLAKAESEKTSIETAARDFRRASYEKILQDNADYIATAHHMGDQAETVLFRLARGSSLTGVSGMRKVDGKYLKPFLSKSKEEILHLVEESGYGYCTDVTNFDRCATRNKIRLDVLPALEEAVTGATGSIARFAEIAAEDDEFLYRLAQEYVDEHSLLFCEEKPIFRRACMLILKSLGKEKDVSGHLLDEAYSLQSMQTGSRLTFKRGVEVKKIYDRLYFYQTEEREETAEFLFEKGRFIWGRYEITVGDVPKEGALTFDFDEIEEGATIRQTRTGDVIDKFGGGRKTVKKYLTDKKIDADGRKSLPVVAGEDGTVYLIGGVDISSRCKVTEKTRKIGYFTIEKIS